MSDYIFYGNTRALKIIHGHGSGALKKAVREWCISQEGRFQAVIYGEDYDLFDQNIPNPINPGILKPSQKINQKLRL